MTEKPYDENWIDVNDMLPGAQGQDSPEVFVFLNGHCGITNHEARQGGPWGLQKGFYDAEKGGWRVGGQMNGWVTHWQPLIKPPQSAMDDYKPVRVLRLYDEEVEQITEALRSSKGDSGASREDRELADRIEEEVSED